MSTFNCLDLGTLGSQLIMPRNWPETLNPKPYTTYDRAILANYQT